LDSSQLPDHSTSIHSDYELEVKNDIEEQNDTQPPELSNEEDEEITGPISQRYECAVSALGVLARPIPCLGR
jgi:hypothetical protein